MLRRLHTSLLLLTAATMDGLCSAQVPHLYAINDYRSMYLQFHQANYWQQQLNNYVSEVEIPADMTFDGIVYPSFAVRFRGNTSYTQLPADSDKKSFNIRTDVFVPGQDIYGDDHLNLNNGFHDPTFLCEFLSYYVMRRHGPAPNLSLGNGPAGGLFSLGLSNGAEYLPWGFVPVDMIALVRGYSVEVQRDDFLRVGDDRVVVEFKFHDRVPAWMNALAQRYGLERRSFSKYGHSMERALEGRDPGQERR